MSRYNSIFEQDIFTDIKHNYKVLIVEDDDIAFFLLSEILSSYPIHIERACNGEEAVNFFLLDKPTCDLVLMDMRLPKINGYDATRRIKEINPSVPIIAVTACVHSQAIVNCFESGCDDFIAKPIDINIILKKIENFLILKN